MKKKGFWSSLFGIDDKPSSASVAADRLKVIVASEYRLQSRLTPERIERMKREIIEVVSRYVSGVGAEDVSIRHHTEERFDMLEMSINLPERK